MNKIQGSWIAGLLEGEGCFSISKHIRKERKGYVEYSTRVVVNNTSKDLLAYTQKLIGKGRIYFKEDKRPNTKNQHQLVIYRRGEIEQLINEISPFLVTKKLPAETVMKFLNLSTRDKDYEKQAEKLYRRIKVLNERGTGS